MKQTLFVFVMKSKINAVILKTIFGLPVKIRRKSSWFFTFPYALGKHKHLTRTE